MAKEKKAVSMEEKLWAACNKLRGKVDPAEYKHVVLWLIFLKFVSDKFEHRKQELIDEWKGDFIDMPAFYTAKNVFYLPETARWSYLKDNWKQSNLANLIDSALETIETKNPSLAWALPSNYYTRLNLDETKLASLLDDIGKIPTYEDKENDIIWRVYEYFLSKFALSEWKGKGEFYTPKSIVKLITELIEPYRWKIYDPACGSWGMFVQSMKFVEKHHWNTKDISIYWQEQNDTTYKLAKMNLAIRWITADLWKEPEDTFKKDQHKDLKADYIMANPPFNLKNWREKDELTDDPRWDGYEVPPEWNANYGWILHMVSKLAQNGVAWFLLANGALKWGDNEYKIRKKLIENDLVETIMILPQNMFYTTNISVTLWILNKNKKARTLEVNGEIKNYRDRQHEILFMDLREMWIPLEKKYTQFSEEDINKIKNTYHTWQSTKCESEYKDTPEYCHSANIEEIRKKDYSLSPSNYIKFVDRDESANYEDKMKELQKEFWELLKEEEKSKDDLLLVFKNLWYDIEY